jgi:hypothetical protein
MEYYVIGPDGSKYGPADVDILNIWINEGRIIPSTKIETDSGTSLMAMDVQGIVFPNTPDYSVHASAAGDDLPAQSPSNPQQLDETNQGGNEVAIACLLGSITLIIGWICCPIGLGCSIGGIILSVQGMNRKRYGALAALIFNIIALMLSLLGLSFFTLGSSIFS